MYLVCARAAHTIYPTSTIWSSKPAVKQLGPIASGQSRQRLLEVKLSDQGSRLLSLLCSHPVIWQPVVPRNPSAQFLSQEDSESCSCLRGTGPGEPPETPRTHSYHDPHLRKSLPEHWCCHQGQHCFKWKWLLLHLPSPHLPRIQSTAYRCRSQV